MKLNTDDYRVPQGKKLKLKNCPTMVKPAYESKRGYRQILAAHVVELSELQQLLYAANSYALLVIFQAMDAAGKDGAIKHVMSGVNPQGCQVFSFKHPSGAELEHDFLWRTNQCLPARGQIGIFNRSYYEEVLIVRVHPEMLASEGAARAHPGGKTAWKERYRSIVQQEEHLTCNGTRIIKFFLHMSKDEQRRRFLARIDEPEKNWKFSQADMTERSFWDDYMEAYQDCLSATSTHAAPWYVVPADDKENARLIVSRIILDRLRALGMSYPSSDPQRQQELLAIRKNLLK